MKKREKRNNEVIELPNQESIRIFGEKENYNYLGILEANKRKWKKRIP